MDRSSRIAAGSWFADLGRDLRYAVRTLRQNPGFTAVAVLTLAIGIGANAVVFSVTNAVLFKGFPGVQGNDRILYMTSGVGCCVSYPDFEDWHAQATSFTGMALVHGLPKTFSDETSGFAERYDATEITAGTFTLVGQKPFLGRDFTSSDERPGAAPVVILRHGFWQRRFGADRAVLGRTVRLNGIPTTVVGVMPPGFSFPQNQQFWVPLVPTPEVRRRDVRQTWFVFGRMAGGVTLEGARAEMENIGRRLAAAYPLTNQGRNAVPHVETFDSFFIGSTASTTYKTMWGAVAIVLLIACANVANLLLARGRRRSREISVRMALGAGRWRIVRQLLVEAMLLSVMGGVAGWWIGSWGLHAYASAVTGAGVSGQTPGTWFNDVLDYSMDYRVFAYLTTISIGTGVLFGLAPASRLSRVDVNAALKDGGRSASSGRRGRHLSGGLVAVEIALAAVLLAGAGVMVRSFLNVYYNADLGFNPANVVTALISLPEGSYRDAETRTSFYDRLGSRLSSSPGVESVAIASASPAADTAALAYEIAGAPPVDVRSRPTTAAVTIGGQYFGTLGAAMQSGRTFGDDEGRAGIPAVIVNQAFANRAWPGEDALGKRLRLFNGTTPDEWLTVVGIAPNLAQSRTPQADQAVVYLPYRQRLSGEMWVLARTSVPAATVTAAVRRDVQSLDPDLPIVDGPAPLAERLTRAYQYKGIVAVLFVTLATIALLLASIGLYAVTAHSVSQRTREIGIRTAVGATRRDIIQLVLRQGLPPLAAGLLVGLLASLPANRLLAAELVRVSPTDPLTLVVTAGLLMASAMLGCLVPARRALRVEPVTALMPD